MSRTSHTLRIEWYSVTQPVSFAETLQVRAIRESTMRNCPLCDGRLPEIGSTEDAMAVRLPSTGMPLEAIERQAVVEALKMSKWVQKDAAALLRISPRVINYKIRKLEIEIPRRSRVMVEPVPDALKPSTIFAGTERRR